MRFKKSATLALALCLILVLAACKAPAPTDTGTSDKPPAADTTVGFYLKAKNGADLIVTLDGGVTEMSADKELFDAFNTGDKIEITHSETAETYPAKTHVYSVKLIERGDESRIPQQVIENLKDLGWI